MSKVDNAVQSPPSEQRPISQSFLSTHGVVLATALPLCMAVGHVQADPILISTSLPPPPSDELDPDFRCYLNDDEPFPSFVCPIKEEQPREFRNAVITLSDTEVLGFSSFSTPDDNCNTRIESGYDEYGLGEQGVGVNSFFCNGGDNYYGEDKYQLNNGETLLLDVWEKEAYEDQYGGFFESTSPMLGVYLTGVNVGFSGGECISESGSIAVFSPTEPAIFIGWSADDSNGLCTRAGEDQTIYVGFSESPVDVETIRITVDAGSFDGGEGGSAFGVTVAGIETCGGGTFDNEKGRCSTTIIPIDDPVFPGAGITTESTSPGDIPVELVGRFRILDPRPACQPGAATLPTTANAALAFDGDYDGDDSTIRIWEGDFSQGQVLIEEFEDSEDFDLKVRNDDALDAVYLNVSQYACGVPRGPNPDRPLPNLDPNDPSPLGPVVPRTPGGNWAPFIDVIALESAVDPVDTLIEFRALGLNGTPFACVDNRASGAATLDQAFLEINARDDEIKYVTGSGGPANISAVGRDIMVGCGSQRAFSRRYSFLTYNVIHAPQIAAIDLQEKTRQEIAALTDTVNRIAASCVDSAFYYSYLRSRPVLIKRYFDLGVRYAGFNRASTARSLFQRAALEAERMRQGLESPGAAGGFSQCYVGGASGDFDEVVSGPQNGAKAYNAFGDLVSQLAHLSYVLRSFRNEMSD